MRHAEKVQQQFNQQAEKFASWEVTSNEVNLQQFSRFCKFKQEDKVLEIACGTGHMAIHCSPLVASVDAVDISEGMVAVGQREADRVKATNVRFSVGPVEHLPFADGDHTVVMSRAAFHHFVDPRRVVDEMLRCCAPSGRLCIQDIIAYDDPEIDAYVEELECAIDQSHFRSLHKNEFVALFEEAGLTAIQGVEFQVALDLANYVEHAIQSAELRQKLDDLIKHGMADAKLSSTFLQRDGRVFLLRSVIFLSGSKAAQAETRKKTAKPRIVRLGLNPSATA